MSTLKEIVESLEKIKTKYVIEKNYEKAAAVRKIIKTIEEHILNEKR